MTISTSGSPSTPRFSTPALLAAWAAACLLAAPLALAAPRASTSEASGASASEGSASEGGLAEDDGIFVEAIDVNLVNLEVYVTDRKGNRIRGLTKDDFVLTVDKSPMAISNFYVVEEGRPLTEQPEVLEQPAPEAEERLGLPLRRSQFVDTRPDEQKLHLIVYVDNFNLKPFSRNRVIRAARNFLRTQMRPGDQVMLVSYDRSLKIRHPFTSDPELIASALYELEDVTGHRVHFDSERRDLLSEVYDEDRYREIYQVRGRVTQYAESIHNDMMFTLDALNEQVESLAGLPGRKAILYVAEGLPMRAGEDVFWALNDRFLESSVLMDSQRYDISRRFQSLITKANTNRVTFYTVDAAGLRTFTYMDASNASVGGGAQIDQIHFANMQSSLLFLAEETGGFAMINTNNFNRGLERMGSDFGNYYSLGFTPGEQGTGRYHRIKVQLKEKRKGVRLRYREGYRNRPVSTRMADGALAALHYGYQSNNLGIELTAGRERPSEDGLYYLPLVVKLPIGKLTFLPSQEMQRGRVRLYIANKDSEGGLAEVMEVPVPIDIPAADFTRAKDQFYHYELTLVVAPGRQTVAVGVRDEIGATVGYATRPITIGS
ncbi:MAG: VWA domain-containing protein [Acidobacteriota bacterium]